jgi:tripeptide aminopeptidase
MINESRLIQLFLDLCKIDAPSLKEKEVVEWMKGFLNTHGLAWVEDNAGEKIGGNANNLIVTIPGNVKDAPRIFFSAHFDTVEPTPDIVVEEIDGVFHATSDTILGADDYAGMAPAIEAVLSTIESGDPRGDIVLLLSVAEEIGLKGAAAMDLSGLNLDFGYVLDTSPPVGSFVNRTANHDKLDIKIKGVPAHAGKDPENGVNAVKVLADAVSVMKLGRIDAQTTANIGVVSGGTATNVVCAEVIVKAEARSTNQETLDAQIQHMIACFQNSAEKNGATVEFNHIRHYKAYVVADDATVVRVGQQAAVNLGLEPSLRTTLGGSDANIFNAKGLSSIVLATGMEKIHTHDEHVSRADLVKTAELVKEIIAISSKMSRSDL